MFILLAIIMFILIIGLFNAYRNAIKQYNLQLALNHKLITVIKKRAELLDENIQW